MGKAKKCAVDKLADTINKVLQDYADEVSTNTTNAVKDVTKAAVNAVKANSRSEFDGTGKYAKGWTSTLETGRLSAQGTVYNKDLPGLPHLLEHGHATRGGGRAPVSGIEHIAPVEEKIIEQFRKEIESKL